MKNPFKASLRLRPPTRPLSPSPPPPPPPTTHQPCFLNTNKEAVIYDLTAMVHYVLNVLDVGQPRQAHCHVLFFLFFPSFFGGVLAARNLSSSLPRSFLSRLLLLILRPHTSLLPEGLLILVRFVSRSMRKPVTRRLFSDVCCKKKKVYHSPRLCIPEEARLLELLHPFPCHVLVFFFFFLNNNI